MAQKSWPSGAPARAAAACIAEMPGATTISMRRARVRQAAGVEALEDERRHRVDAGVAGRDERDGAAFRRQRQRLPHARLLRAERGIEALGMRDERRDEIEIERVADRRVARLEQAPRLRRQPFGAARADADDRESSARAADASSDR